MSVKEYQIDAIELNRAYDYEWEIPFRQVEDREKVSWFYLSSKRVMDVLCSLIGILLSSPLLLGVAITIKLTSKGPAIYKHKRIGYHGNTIQVYKFRSMVQDAENLGKYMTPEQSLEFKQNFKLDNDPRITKIGALIRKTSIDELPQLINILKGDMSMVGPRPIVEDELEKYGTYAHDYLSVKPGLTGMWQVHGRSTTTYEERVLMDASYVQNRCISGDAKLIVQTVGVVLSRKGAY